MDFQIFKAQFEWSKLIRLKSYLHHWKAIGTQMSKMGLYDHLNTYNTSYGQKKVKNQSVNLTPDH